MVDPSDDLVDALAAGPVGVALLAALETRERGDVLPFDVPGHADPAAIERAAHALEGWPFARLLAVALDAADRHAGPWMPGVPKALALAYRDAPARRPIAVAIAQRFGAALHAELDPGAQEWWTDDRRRALPPARFTGRGPVYGNGEFTFDGLWTVTAPPPEAHVGLLTGWELDDTPVRRWRLPVRPPVRVVEIHRPLDWARLVAAHPHPAPPRSHSGWELPGPNQHRADIAALLAAPGQRAARTAVGSHVLPDWSSVARHHDGVHLSWAGFLTTEAFVADLGDGAVTMLRYWASERTLWLHDVFGQPEPLPAPTLDDDDDDDAAGPARGPSDPDQHERDRAHLAALLGR